MADSADTEEDTNPLEANLGESAVSARLRGALRDARQRLKRLEAENEALREELLNAGEMIETLAVDLEKRVDA